MELDGVEAAIAIFSIDVVDDSSLAFLFRGVCDLVLGGSGGQMTRTLPATGDGRTI